MTPTQAPLADVSRQNGRPPETEPDAPYVGLSFYTEADASLFFGRDSERQVIMGNLRASRLTLLYAQSGVGKSSLLRAGVAARLRQLAGESLAGSGAAPQVPVVFNAWKDDPVQELIDEILAATNMLLGASASQLDLPRDSVKSAIDVAVLALERAVAGDGSERTGSSLLIILDQFEEYFLYRGREGRIERFADELAECINQPNLRANFLISIREDAYSALGDLLRGRMSNVYGNYLHLEYLDDRCAREAIEKPIDHFNSTVAPDRRVTIEPGLVDAVLREVRPVAAIESGNGAAPSPRDDGSSEVSTPFLQLVMTAIWNRERAQHSTSLRLSTLGELQGAENIVARHLASALSGLSSDDRELAVEVLHHLVTPSGSKIALEVADLAAYTRFPPDRVFAVLEDLARAQRILREIPPRPGKSADHQDDRRFEIYHDVLATPINEIVGEAATRRLEHDKEVAQTQARQERNRARISTALAIVATALLVVAVIAVILATNATDRARRAQHLALSREIASRSESESSNGNLVRGVLLAIQATRTAQTSDARKALMNAMLDTADMRSLLTGPKETVTGVAYSPDGSMFASADIDRRVIVWNARTARTLAVLHGSTQFTGVAFSPDGVALAASDASGHVTVWNATTRRRLRTLDDGGQVETIAFDPVRDLLATANADGKVTLWNWRTGARLRTVEHDSSVVYTVAFSPSGRRLATGDADGLVAFFDPVTGRALGGRRVASDVNAIAYSPNGRTIAVGTNSLILVYGAHTRRPERRLNPGDGAVYSVAFSPDGSTLAAGSGANHDGEVSLWDQRSGRLLLARQGPATVVNSVAFNRTGDTLAAGGSSTAGDDPSLIIWDVRPKGLRVLWGQTGQVTSLAYSPGGRLLASGGSRGRVVVWNAVTGARLEALNTGGSGTLPVAFSPSGRVLASAGKGATTDLWNPSDGRRIRVLRGHRAQVFSLAFSRDGKLLASAGPDEDVIVWNTATGRVVDRLVGQRTTINAVVFGPDDRTLVSAGDDGSMIVWNTETGRPQKTLTAPRSIGGLAVSPTAEMIASGGADWNVSLWNPRTGALLGDPLSGQDDNIPSLAFSPNGRAVVSGSGDDSAVVWNLSSRLGVPVGRLTSPVASVAYSPDGHSVAVGSTDSAVAVQPAPLLSDITESGVTQHLCRVIQDNLSRTEWHQYIPDEPYERTCQS